MRCYICILNGIYNLVRKNTVPCACGCKDFKRAELNVLLF